MAKRSTAKSDVVIDEPKGPLYERDEHRWIEEQVGLLRDSRFDQLDQENLIKHLLEMISRDQRELKRRCTIMLRMLLNFEAATIAGMPLPAHVYQICKTTLIDEQNEINSMLDLMPSLRQSLAAVFPLAYTVAAGLVARDYEIDPKLLPMTSAWTPDQALNAVPQPP